MQDRVTVDYSDAKQQKHTYNGTARGHMVIYTPLPKVFVQRQISTHISSHISTYHNKYILNKVSIKSFI